jgi:hypothetical protein
MMVNLSPKALRFMVEALEYRVVAYEAQLEDETLDDDQVSDVTNDLMFVESLLEDLKKSLEAPIAQVF